MSNWTSRGAAEHHQAPEPAQSGCSSTDLGEAPATVPERSSLWTRWRVRDLASALLLVVLVLLFFWRILTPKLADRGSFASGDFVDQFYAFARVAAGQLRQGHLPLWSPNGYSGHPFLADIQAAIYYPPSLLTALLFGSGQMMLFALELEVVLHFCLAAIFTYAFARRVIGRRDAALLSAVAFTFGGYLTGYPPLQFAILKTDIWLPLILLGLEVGISRLESGHRVAWTAFLGAGLALGLALLAGHPQSAMYVGYASVAYALFRIWKIPNRRRGLAGLGLFLLIGVGLSAAQWLPSLEYFRLSTRAQLSYGDLSNGFSLADLVQLVLPSQSALYVGVLPLLLALVAPWIDRSRSVSFWAGQGLVSLLLALGGNLFLYPLFYLLVPGFALFRSQERAVFLFGFSLALMAGFGFARLMEHPPPEWLRKLSRWLLASAGGLTLIAYYGWVAGQQATPAPFWWLLHQGVYLVLLLGGIALLLWWRAKGGAGAAVLAAAMALVVFDLFTVNATRNLDRRLPEEHTQPSPLIQEMQADPDLFRVYNEWQLPGNFGYQFDLEGVRGASPLKIERYNRLIEEVPREFGWQLLNVKYVATWEATLGISSTVVITESNGSDTAYLHRLADHKPRAWIVHEAEVIPDDDEVIARLSDYRFSPFQAAILPEPPPVPLGQTDTGSGPSSVHWRVRTPSRLVLDVVLPSDGLLVLSEVHYPGWRTWVDGEPAPTLRTDLILRGVALPAGTHCVEMVFSPWTVPLGLGFSALTLAATLAFLLWARRSRK